MKEQEFYTLAPGNKIQPEHGLLWVKEDRLPFMLDEETYPDIWSMRSVATGASRFIHKNRLTSLCK